MHAVGAWYAARAMTSRLRAQAAAYACILGARLKRRAQLRLLLKDAQCTAWYCVLHDVIAPYQPAGTLHRVLS